MHLSISNSISFDAFVKFNFIWWICLRMNGIYVISLLILKRLFCESFSLSIDNYISRQNMRLTNHFLENKTNIGIGMCIRDCRALSGCKSVNYNIFYSVCELNSLIADDNSTYHFENQTGTFFVDVTSTEFLSNVSEFLNIATL